jgi:hypothetical protein
MADGLNARPMGDFVEVTPGRRGGGLRQGRLAMTDTYRPSRSCVCIPRALPDGNGGCNRCGKPLIGRCERTGITVPECGCPPCAKRLQEEHRR